MPDGPVLAWRAGNREAELSFASYLPGDEYISEFTVTVNANGLNASAPIISTPGGDGLPGFIQKLTDDFRGWTGTRSWRSLEHQLLLDATWKSGGHVALVFRLTPSLYDKWNLDVEFTLDSGEELQEFARDLAAFFDG